jgi:regulator of replication initiation timing
VLTCSRRNWSSLQAVANRVRNKKSSHILDEADRLEDQLNHERQALEEDYAQLIEERARVRTHEEKLRALLDQEPEGEDGANLGRDQIHRRLEESRQRVLALDLRAKRIRNILQATSDEDS